MDTRKLIAHIDGESGDEGRIEQDGYGILCSMTGAGGIDILPEIVKRWNAYPELVEALKGLVQTIEFQAEGNFLNEDADEGEENDLTRARTILATLKTN